MSFETKKCPVCKREFVVLPDRCLDHCVQACCRAAKCPNTRQHWRAYREHRQAQKKCIVCGRPGHMFKRFAPCDENCNRYFHASTRGTWARTWMCAGVERDNVNQRFHKPAGKPRYHRLYCSIWCYNHPERGHQARVRGTWRQHYHRNAENIKARRLEERQKHGRRDQ